METNQKAIALHYEKETDNAPKILTKGRGDIANKIIKIAQEYNIPIYEDNILSEILDKINIGYEIPEYLYEIIAEIYAFTYKVMKRTDKTI